MTFLTEEAEDQPNEYLLSLTREVGTGSLFWQLVGRAPLTAAFEEHIGAEADLLLSTRDLQEGIRDASRAVHGSLRRLARLSAAIPVDPAAPAPPLLRRFAGSLITFLNQMCINRGCRDPLRRAMELSLRDECFPFLTIDPTVRRRVPIPPCVARYTPP